MSWRRKATKLAAKVDDRIDGLKSRLEARFGSNRAIIVRPYRWYGTRDTLRVRGRVLRHNKLRGAADGDSWFDDLRNSYRRFNNLALSLCAEAKVKVTMIFRRTLLREFAITGIGTLLILLAITVTTQFIRFLGYAARGRISTDAVVTFLGLAGLRYLRILLSLALFISILLSLSRAYRDSEMVVWFTSGQGLLSWIRPTLLYALPLVFTIGLLSRFFRGF